jgi:hypothetical protein
MDDGFAAAEVLGYLLFKAVDSSGELEQTRAHSLLKDAPTVQW